MSIASLYDQLESAADGGVNPPISDSATYAFDDADDMHRLIAGMPSSRSFVYARHRTATTARLGALMAALEDTEAGHPTASGMAAIAAVVLHYCSAGDEIVCARTVYGGTHALFANLLPRFGVTTRFVDLEDDVALASAIGSRTRLIYAESLSNPLLEVANLPRLAERARACGAKLVVDNTFLAGIAYPARHGADVVIHSLTKFANGMSDAIAGAICGPATLIDGILDVQAGSAMLLGGVLDNSRAATIAKNLHTLQIRMMRHGENALSVAKSLEGVCAVTYPGLRGHAHHGRFTSLHGTAAGFGGLLTVDAGSTGAANALARHLVAAKAGFLAVSLGSYRTLFSVSATSTASELAPAEQSARGMSPGLVRISVGLEPTMEPLIRGITGALASPRDA